LPEDGKKDDKKDGKKELFERQMLICKIIKESPSISIPDLARKTRELLKRQKR